ncbi:hypothetical protein AWB57_10265 [Riemerella anatipestifer]|uniref:hypothetical protein n=1 Tax=Riemerella anatipestifer TaxID=34085 RepID=UPI0007EE01F0|nr:hypothetical protein [Riemerella anatipestifer]AZZ59370.1 hypothetical protein AWB57_10265 [Riemerella anatipestifer]MDY3391944.1 hypothetical protein [Riemerella anatipestifer]
MKTKTTKLSVFAFLGLGLVVYGQSGKVGVNTSSPQATLDIQPTAKNGDVTATTNEGILAPKLSKTRVASIATPVEGTLVYVIDDTSKTKGAISDYIGNDIKVAKITEKGYYYYNGTEWVRRAGNNDDIWQKQSNNDIKLIDGNIESNISYSSVGAFKNVPKVLRNYSKHNPSTQQIETGSIDLSSMNLGNSLNINLGYADKIPVSYVDPLYKEKQLIHNYLLVDEKNDAGVYNRIFGQRNTIATTATTASNYSALYANVNASEHYGKGKINLMIGDYSIATLYDGSADRVVGAYSQASSYTANQTPYMTAAFNYLTPRGTGEVNQLFGTENRIHLNKYSKGTLNAVALNYNQAIITDTWTGKIGRLVGNSTYFNIPTTINSIDEMYGLVVANVDRGVNKNYAIYTNAGENSFGDKVTIRNHNWTSNQETIFQFINGTSVDGTKKVNATTQIVDQMNGRGDGGSNLIFRTQSPTLGTNPNLTLPTEKMRISADGAVGIGVESPAEKLEVAGNVKATGFIGTNAAIFPDYVFQKYYTGTSSIKSDYSFKTLSQVEDFVKTNGHLPGYQSAEAIKKQGYIDLMATQLTNVEKIEELYLHSIEQDKALKSKDAKIAELEARLQKLEALLVK